MGYIELILLYLKDILYFFKLKLQYEIEHSVNP